MKCDPLNPGHWRDIVEEIYSMEKLTYTLRNKAESPDNAGGSEPYSRARRGLLQS